MAIKRTPALTKRVRELFEYAWTNDLWVWSSTTLAMADQTGLSVEQVRDAIFGKSADTWRREYMARERERRRLEREAIERYADPELVNEPTGAGGDLPGDGSGSEGEGRG
jgi:hypothetical protein